MNQIDKISEYLLSLGFEETQCRIPLNRFERNKRGLYSRIFKKSEYIFKFLNKLFPIKFRSKRFDNSLWFIIRDENTDKCIIELAFRPDGSWNHNYPEGDFNFDKYKMVIFPNHVDNLSLELDMLDSFYINISKIESFFTKNALLNERVRDKKLEFLLNG